MYPATPTPLPPAELAPISLNANMWRIWNFADDAIMVWQQMGSSRTQVFQVALLLVLLIGFVYLVITWLQSLTEGINN
jgi:hypothetical protein